MHGHKNVGSYLDSFLRPKPRIADIEQTVDAFGAVAKKFKEGFYK